jgi:hypothetical protein
MSFSLLCIYFSRVRKLMFGLFLNSKNVVAWGPPVGLLSLRARPHTSGAVFHAASMLTAPATRRTSTPPYPVVGSYTTTLSRT